MQLHNQSAAALTPLEDNNVVFPQDTICVSLPPARSVNAKLRFCLGQPWRPSFARPSSRLTSGDGPLQIMACPGVLALFASQRKNPILVSVMVAVGCLSCVASFFVLGYSCLTLTYGEEDNDVFHHHDSLKVTFVLHRMVKAANATILLCCILNVVLSSLIAYVGCRSLPRCGCYDAQTGLATLVPQCDPGDTELVCTWQAGGDDRLFNSPAQTTDSGTIEEEVSSKLPPYSRLT
ncbi:uncharacterized protein zgc:113425 isoform X2 [Syngnathus scovelli]|uniref:uncharacterized protein zgc:113425 isoform X2 n=1 Tax=Syngnathus scovelli TaxID=161590 RepID=UPI002110AEDC|nr:uncharacterized protein zgc:113425 isoform X2 [Syngnathus scovelli]